MNRLKLRESLTGHGELLFDENSYSTSPAKPEIALSYVRYFSQNAPRFRGQLMERGWEPEEINVLIDELWRRVILGCMRHGIPLTREASHVAKRLGFVY